jgi:RTX calcium-binding nonapeptide repeat (4 copies)
MIRFLSKLLGDNVVRTHGKPAAASRREARPAMEQLEDRLVPTVVTSFHPPRVTLNLGMLHIDCQDRLKGGPFNQSVTVETVDSYWGLEYHVRWSTRTTHRDYYFTPAQLYGGVVFFTGAKGDDTFQNNTDLRSYAWGGLGNDTLIGGTNQDVLMGEQGNDKIYGGGGKDFLSGGDDNDYIDGGGAFVNGQYRDNFDGVADYINGNGGADKFKAEWVYNGISVLNRTNLDAPQDFNAAQGDTIVNPVFPVAANFTNAPVVSLQFGK